MINMGEIFGHDRISDIEMERVQLNDRELATMLVREGDLLFARQSLVLAGAGKCTLVEQVNEPTTFESHIIRVRLDPKKADPRFYHYLFQSPYSGIKAIVTQGVQAGIRASDLAVLKVPVPDPDEQRRIAAVLSSYDDLIENNRKRIKLLERAARLLYTEWFVRGRFPGHQVVKKKDGVPEGWEKLPSDQVMDIGSGGTPRTHKSEYWDGDIPFFTPKDVTDSIYSWETERTVTEEGVKNCNTSIYPKDTVYITARGTVGNLCMGQRPMAMNQSCFALQAKPPLSQYYLLFALKEAVPHFLNQSSGSVFDAIVRVAFTRVKVIVPTKEVVDRFTELVTPMVKQVDVLSQQNRQLTRARDLLLPRLMNGKVRV